MRLGGALKTIIQRGRRREETAGVPSGYVEDFFASRTKWGIVFSVPHLFGELLNDVAQLRQDERFHGETDGAF